ncbi:hypothetical protein MRY82_10055 [bacterium]|nr:hypothetical protein [bacterium]
MFKNCIQKFYYLLIPAYLFLYSCGSGLQLAGQGESIQVSVSGLNGLLTLQNNGEDDLHFTEDGSLEFSLPLDLGANYQLSVVSEPSTQNCTINSDRGVVTLGLKITVNCLDKEWVDPLNDTDGVMLGSSGSFGIWPALNNNGLGFVFWEQRNASGDLSIYMSEFNEGVWTDPSDLNDQFNIDASSIAENPRLDLNDNGYGVLTWGQRNSSNAWQIMRAEYINGSWQQPANKDAHFTLGATATLNGAAEVVVNEVGDASIIWLQSDGSNNRVLRTEKAALGNWSNTVDPTSDAISPAGQTAILPIIVMNDARQGIITWRQSDGTRQQIFRSYRYGSNWVDPSGLTDNPTPDTPVPSAQPWGTYNDAAINASGQGIMAWVQQDNLGENRIFYSYLDGGVWDDPNSESDADHILSPAGNAVPGSFFTWAVPNVSVAIEDNGDAMVTWTQLDGSTNCGGSDCGVLMYARYVNGVWQRPINVGTEHLSQDGFVVVSKQIEVDKDGRYVLIFIEQTSLSDEVMYRMEYINETWTTPEQISPAGTVVDNYHFMDLNRNGDALLGWGATGGSIVNSGVLRSFYR